METEDPVASEDPEEPRRGHPLVRDVYPELIAELGTLLEQEGEPWLAISAHDVRLIAPCGCGDDFCQSIRTEDWPPGQPYGRGHRCVALLPTGGGMLNLDIVDNRIVYLEILDRPPLVDRRPPLDEPANSP